MSTHETSGAALQTLAEQRNELAREVARLRAVMQEVIDNRADFGLEIDDPVIVTLRDALPAPGTRHSWEGCRICGWVGPLDTAYTHTKGCMDCTQKKGLRVFGGTRVDYLVMRSDPKGLERED